VVLDSCRYDTFMAAKPRVMTKLAKPEKRYTYATWTAPSHYNMLMGLLPHPSPKNVYASEYYKDDFLKFSTRLGVEDIHFGRMVPRLWLPDYLRNTVGYRTNALVSMPVLNPATPIHTDFDQFELMDAHNDMAAMLPKMRFYHDRPSFHLLNVGETHYPYALPSEPENEWPRISGVNGVFKHLDEQIQNGKLVREQDAPKFFDADKLAALKERQVEAVRYIDTVVEQLFDMVPDGTWITITSDHGELFGERGYFGHGPINHSKVIEVPFLEGRLR
jgi:hypothetical protein